MAHPAKSGLETFESILKNSIGLPEYQRDFAWDIEKMKQLWDDLRGHVFAQSQTLGLEKLEKYYLGAVVTDSSDGITVVDGQQRFTSMTLISCALRDALIATGHVRDAHDIQQKLILAINNTISEYEPPKSKFTLLDNPKGHHLSSEYRLSPYRNRVVNIPTGMITSGNSKSKYVDIDTELSSKIKWSVDERESWEFLLWDNNKKEFYGGKENIYRTSNNENNNLMFNSNPPNKIYLNRKIESILHGLEIILLNNVDWCIKCNCTLKNRNCDFFAKDNREFYLYVRTDIEQLIRSEKKYYPSKGLSCNQFSSSLKLVQDKPTEMIQSVSQSPKFPIDVVFYEEVPDMEPWPTEQELWELILEHPKSSENRHVELKQSLRFPYYNGKVRRNSHLMIQSCMRAVASMLNTKGGFLFIGVTNDGIVRGINDEEYDDHDEAAMTLQQYVINYLGALQEKYVEIKVIQDHNLNDVMVAKVTKCSIPTYMMYSKFDDNGGKIKGSETEAFFVKNNQSVSDYGPISMIKEKEDHIKTFFQDNSSKSKLIEHTFRRGSFQLKDIPHAPKLVRDFAECKNEGCDFIGKTSEELISHLKNCEFKDNHEKNHIPENSYCLIPYRAEPWPDWLNDEKMRVSQLKKLILNTSFTIIGFKDSKSAVEHFMLTNDSSRFEPLNSYDLVSAFTVKLMRPKNNEDLSTEQREIKRLWKSVSNDLYITTEKNDKKINSFFFNWLLSTGRREKPAKRYTKDKSWNGIKKEFDDRTNDDGSYQMEKMVELYSEMQHFAKIYLRLTDTNHKFWKEEPYSNVPFREERNILRILGTNTSEVQHIPPLMCLTNRLYETEIGRNMIIKFLKNYNYILLRYKTIPVSTGGSPGIKGGDIYGKMQSGKGVDWISKILNADFDKQEDIDMIGELPLELENDVSDKELYIWDKDNPKWYKINQWHEGKHNKSKIQIRHLLFSAERALNTEKNPSMASIHVKNKDIHVEHILPEDYSNYYYEDDNGNGYIWPFDKADENGLKTEEVFKKYWKKYVYSLGNQCLLSDTKNSEIKNIDSNAKFRKETFKNSDFLTARSTHNLWSEREPKFWEPDVIEQNSYTYMQAIISFFDPSN